MKVGVEGGEATAVVVVAVVVVLVMVVVVVSSVEGGSPEGLILPVGASRWGASSILIA